jgi:hypothetical protein
MRHFSIRIVRRGDGGITNQLTSVIIPDSVTTIAGDAFYRNDPLTEVSIGAGVDISTGGGGVIAPRLIKQNGVAL